MARKRKKTPETGPVWLITFADMATLLLTLFVLLASMASVDARFLKRISLRQEAVFPAEGFFRERVPENVRLLLEITRDPQAPPEKNGLAKDLLFPKELLPAGLSPGTLEKEIYVSGSPEGIRIALSDDLLFDSGTNAITPAGKHLLGAVATFLYHTTADVNIGGHADTAQAARGPEAYNASGRRAVSVLEYFLHENFPPARFSISAYGASRPLEPDTTEENRRITRRIEILVKTAQRSGWYL